jgi:hypothetical protein
MYETYRMPGREHELDLERAVGKRHLAIAVRAERERSPAKARVEPERQKWARLVPRRLGASIR